MQKLSQSMHRACSARACRKPLNLNKPRPTQGCGKTEILEKQDIIFSIILKSCMWILLVICYLFLYLFWQKTQIMRNISQELGFSSMGEVIPEEPSWDISSLSSGIGSGLPWCQELPQRLIFPPPPSNQGFQVLDATSRSPGAWMMVCSLPQLKQEGIWNLESWNHYKGKKHQGHRVQLSTQHHAHVHH